MSTSKLFERRIFILVSIFNTKVYLEADQTSTMDFFNQKSLILDVRLCSKYAYELITLMNHICRDLRTSGI